MPSSTSTPRSCRASQRLRGLQRASADEDRETAEQPLLRRREQRVAPVDGSAQGLLARGQVARAAGQELQAVVETGRQRRRRQELDASRGKLDRQGQTVQPRANRRDRRSVLGREGEAGEKSRGAVNEECDRRHTRQRLGRRQSREVRQRERRDGVLPLCGEVQRRPARHQRLQPPCLGQQPGDRRGGSDNVLEAVQHQ